MGCRLEKSRQWAMRCVNEAALHENNCFVTLTYNDENMPEHGSLYKPDLQKFFKRLRKRRGPFRYYACGEYGEQTKRAHYHACLFGMDFNDRQAFRKIGEHTLDVSNELNEIWGLGHTTVGNLSFETAAYCARYVTKKVIRGVGSVARLDAETGEIIPLVQPFAVMSLRCRGDDGKVGGIGSEWLRKYSNDLYTKDYLAMRGAKMRPPKYYDKLYDLIDPDGMEAIKAKRETEREKTDEYTLRAREKIAHARRIGKTQI